MGKFMEFKASVQSLTMYLNEFYVPKQTDFLLFPTSFMLSNED